MSTNGTKDILTALMVSKCSNSFGSNTHGLCSVSYILVRICPIALLIIGALGNLLTIIILLRKRLRKQSTSTYLIALACSDITCLLATTVRAMVLRYSKVDIRELNVVTCKTVDFFAYSSSLLSIWILVFVTAERMLLTRFPVFARQRMTRKNSIIVITVAFCLIVSFNGHRLYGHKLVNVPKITEKNYANETVVSYAPRCVFVSESYTHFLSEVYSVMFLVTANVVPVILLFVGNIVIVVSLRQKERRIAPNGQQGDSRNAERRNVSVTRMLVTICVYFIVTVTPYTVGFVVLGRLSEDTIETEFPAIMFTAAISYYLMISNYSLNFFFYFVLGTQFKREWNDMVNDVKARILRRSRPERHVTNTTWNTALELTHGH